MIQYTRKGIDMNKFIAAFALVGFFVYTTPALADMASTNYQIQWDSLSEGGSDTASSENYGIHDSVGSLSIGNSTSESYQTDSGYRAGLFDQVITFDILVQDSSASYAVTGRSGTTVSMTNTSGLSVGSSVALIQDRGAGQISAIGFIASIAVNSSITVDSWSDNGTTPVIDGSNDYLYTISSGNSVSFGELSVSSVSTAIVGFEVNADLANGYSIQAIADGTLTNGTTSITDVIDGSVTAGSQEYGAISSDTTLASSTFDTQDSALTTSSQDVVTTASRAFNDRHFLTLKASKASLTPSGTYAQTLTFIASGNF
jgi:hypothetical protein